MTTAILWVWRFGSADPEVEDSFDEALSTFGALMDSDNCSVGDIEVWDENGYRLVEADECEHLYAEHERQREAEHPSAPPCTMIAYVWVRVPNSDRWGCYSGYYETAKANERYEQLRSIIGDDRVKLTSDNHRPW